MKQLIKYLSFFSLTFTYNFIYAQEIKQESIKAYISYLAADNLKGRGTSSEGEQEAAKYIAIQFQNSGLTAFNNSYFKPFKYKYNTNPHDTNVAKHPEKVSQNVVGFLDNGAPYTIVIGGHYDHLGLGHDKNSRDANPENKIHNGADDNASGTAGVIALARYFAKNNKKEPFNFLFICFSGEELGLLGSKKYCESPDIPVEKMNYMINMDMIGRLNKDTKKLMVYGVGTSPIWVNLLDTLKSDFSISKDSSGIGPSDQTSFYLKGVPVLHFFTGQHEDYHKPGDDIDKINFEGEVQVLNYIIRVIEATYKYPKLTFLKTRSQDTGRSKFKVTLGIMPDYTFEGKGLKIDGVTDGKPAHAAGILTGDIILKVGEQDINGMKDYMKVLSSHEKGDTVNAELMRNGKKIVLPVTF